MTPEEIKEVGEKMHETAGKMEVLEEGELLSVLVGQTMDPQSIMGFAMLTSNPEDTSDLANLGRLLVSTMVLYRTVVDLRKMTERAEALEEELLQYRTADPLDLADLLPSDAQGGING